MRSKKFLMGGVATAALLAGSVLVSSPVSAGESATLTVVKTVVGTAPADAEFVINVFCVEAETNGTLPTVDAFTPAGPIEPLVDEDIVFGPSGGEEDFFFGTLALPVDCVITEVEDGGATSSTGPVEVAITNTALFEAEIVNTFDPAPTTAAPTTEAPAAQPAQAAATAATPRFTG